MINKSLPKFKNAQERVEYWRSIYKSRLTSNLSNVAFCAQHKISDASLYRWIKYFEKQQSKNTSLSEASHISSAGKGAARNNQDIAKADFIPVTVATNEQASISPDMLSGAAMELIFPNGMKLFFMKEARIEWLMQLITWRV